MDHILLNETMSDGGSQDDSILDTTLAECLLEYSRETCKAAHDLRVLLQRSNSSFNMSISSLLGGGNGDDYRCGESMLRGPCSDCQTVLFSYVYPCLLSLCLYGNTMNILVYKGQFLRASTTVRLLAAKAFANMAFVAFLLPHSFLAFNMHNPTVEWLYWRTQPYTVTLSNIFGTCAAWYTVLMTVECYVMVAFPVASKQICTRQNVCLAIALSTFLGILINLSNPFLRIVVTEYCADRNTARHYLFIRDAHWARLLDRVTWVLQSATVIILPIVILILLSSLITYEMACKRRAISNYNVQKRCVTRLTLATTSCHLVLETPALIVFISAAVQGSESGNASDSQELLCIINWVTNFLSITNASIPFLIYLGCVEKFRNLFCQLNGCNSLINGDYSNCLPVKLKSRKISRKTLTEDTERTISVQVPLLSTTRVNVAIEANHISQPSLSGNEQNEIML